MDLSKFKSENFQRGRAAWVEFLWLLIQAFFVSSWLPGSIHRVWLLRTFGAEIGRGVVVKPHLRVKFPWRLRIGDHVWLGENVWIDNLALVEIRDNVCVSQGVYLCTGSHDWSGPNFDLVVKPIRISEHAWVCARSTIAPGTKVGKGAVIALGSVASGELIPWHVYSGIPAAVIRARSIKSADCELTPSPIPDQA